MIEDSAVGAPTVVIGTAGHIDHGKTALLRALTGIDADRLPEERARGMTIDVGYAHLAFDGGVELDFVDVPGHDRLIGNMLVGAGEIDAAMLVVAADDGPRPQTIEHLQLLDALAIADGLVVVTKVDLVDAARAQEVVGQVRALLVGTTLAGAPIGTASAVTGQGIADIRLGLRALLDRVVARWAREGGTPGAAGPLRLAIDRVFTARGRGVVATGSLRGGEIATRGFLRLEPGGGTVRVRELQVHGRARECHDGGRTAINVTGSVAGAIRRGAVLTIGPAIRATDRLLVQLRRAAAHGGNGSRPPRSGMPFRLHIGTDQVEATMRRLRGLEGVAILTLAQPVATFAGDRAVLREPAAGAVIAGLLVLDPAPPRGVSRRRLNADRLAALTDAVESRSFDRIEAARLQLHGTMPSEPTPGTQPTIRSMDLAEDVSAPLVDGALEAVAAHHRASPLSPGLPLPRARALLLGQLRSLASIERRHVDAANLVISKLLDGLVADGRLARRGDALRDPSLAHEVSVDLLSAMDRLEAALAVAAPPSLDAAAAASGCPPEGIRALQAEGRIVRLGPDLAWSTATYHRLAAVALDRARVEPLTPAAFRDATGTSRKYVLAILEDLDRRGVLQRTPEGHIPGPRALRPDSAT